MAASSEGDECRKNSAMNTNPLDTEKPPAALPLLYISSLVGLVAALCPMVVAAAVLASLDPKSAFPLAFVFLTPACAGAVTVMIIAGPVLHSLLRVSRRTGRWGYIAGMSIIVGGSFLLFVSWDSRLDPWAALIPVGSIPSGLFFHSLSQTHRRIPPFDRRDVLTIVIWIAAFIFFFAFIFRQPPSTWDPEHGRYAIVGLAWTWGLPVFMLGGISAGLARLRSLRLGTAIAALTWLVPVGFVVVILLTPTGPKSFHFVVSDQAFDIDWHLRPRRTATGFCFDASGRGPYAGFPHPPNPEICVAQIIAPLAPIIPGAAENRRWDEAGLTCVEKLFARRAGGSSSGSICSETNATEGTATLIECPPGYCFHQFDAHGLRYTMHWGPEKFADWYTLQERALRLVAEVAAVPIVPR